MIPYNYIIETPKQIMVWCGMLPPKPTPNLWLTNKSVPWDFTRVPPQLLAFMRANDTSCWAKPWIFIPWCGVLVYALHCNGIMVTSYCLWRQRILVMGHIGPHPWRRELRSWLEKPKEFFDSSSKWWKNSELNGFILLWLLHPRW